MPDQYHAPPEGQSAYTQAEADRLAREFDAFVARKRQRALDSAAQRPACTCSNSDFGMDVERCPVHGEGCA